MLSIHRVFLGKVTSEKSLTFTLDFPTEVFINISKTRVALPDTPIWLHRGVEKVSENQTY